MIRDASHAMYCLFGGGHKHGSLWALSSAFNVEECFLSGGVPGWQGGMREGEGIGVGVR